MWEVAIILRGICLVWAALLFGAACSSFPGTAEPPPAVQLGTVPDTPSAARFTGAPLHPSGFFQFDQWPKACDLLTDADFRAVFPQVSEIRRIPGDTRLKVTTVGLGVFATEDARAVGATCKVALAVPGIDFDRAQPIALSGLVVDIEVNAAGSAEIIEKNPPQKPLPGVTEEVMVGAIRCVSIGASNGLECATPQAVFEVSMRAEHRAKNDEENIIRYQRGGETIAWPRAGGVDGVQRRQEWERSVITTELVKAIAAKL